MFDIITIGSATRDVFLSSRDFKLVKGIEFATGNALALDLGAKLGVDKIVITTGGGGTNTAVTFARQGFKIACIGVVGTDPVGEEIRRDLIHEGIDTSHFQVHDDDISAYSVILVHENGERSIISYKGEGQHFDAGLLDISNLEAPWILIDSVGGHFEIYDKVMMWAEEKKAKIATIPGTKELAGGLAKLKPFLSKCEVVFMNREETAALASQPYSDEKEIFEFMDREIGGIFAMTDGPNGVAISDGKKIYRAGVPDSPIIERTGAGDAFASGFLGEYMRSLDIVKAIQLGTANASSVVTQFGAKAGILHKGGVGPWPLVKVEMSQL